MTKPQFFSLKAYYVWTESNQEWSVMRFRTCWGIVQRHKYAK